MKDASWWTTTVFVTDLTIRLGLSARVIMRRLPTGVSLAWLFIILTFPFAGACAYLMIGELRLGRYRAARAAQFRPPFRAWLTRLQDRCSLDWSAQPSGAKALAQLCRSMIGMPVTCENRLQLLDAYESTLPSLIHDIDAAQQSCHIEFYIWVQGGRTDALEEALLRAAARGVKCRVLLDDVGSREFLRSEAVARLRAGGVAVLAALRAQLWRVFFVRFDLRLHRKIAVIDGRIGYTGSMNLADPCIFKQDAGVGQWVDAMVRIEGPAVDPLEVIFLGDWAMESDESFESLREVYCKHSIEPSGNSPVQVLPSGPAHEPGAIERIVLSTIFTAERTLVLTTPYFVPDESLLTALICAAQRGVDVTVIIPEKVDSRLANLASNAVQGDLVAAGVKVLLYRRGLLHTKSISVDGKFSLFGSLNLDPRSLHLNFEITLAIYDAEFTAGLEKLLSQYEAHSRSLSLAKWQARGLGQKALENVARLVSPLL